MGFWIFMVIILFLIPLSMVVFGKKFIQSAPRRINGCYGYRTSMSMKNQDTWKFAHAYFGKIWYYSGNALLASPLLMFFVMGKDEDTIGYFAMIPLAIQMFFLIGAVLPTERALKARFDKNGNLKS